MKKSRLLILIAAITVIFTAVGGIIAFSEPGETDDPVVTKSYILDKVVPDLKAYVDEKVAAITGSSGGGASFVVVDVPNGKTIVADAGTEMILRKGSGTVIATEKGGLADTTGGYDLGNGAAMPANHMLIVPVGDGRGFTATSDVIVMVKGGYNLK